ncbi:MAG: nitroreductase family protein [Methanomassiliicoccales archaeon]
MSSGGPPSARGLVQAPVVIVCCGDLDRVRKYGERGRKLYTIMDVAASASFISLYLTSRGYGSFWVGCFDETGVSRALGLPDTVRPLILLAVGRPAGERERPGRLDTEDLVHWGGW